MKKINETTRCSYAVNDGGVALMEINNPPMNALSWAVLDEIRDTLTKALACHKRMGDGFTLISDNKGYQVCR